MESEPYIEFTGLFVFRALALSLRVMASYSVEGIFNGRNDPMDPSLSKPEEILYLNPLVSAGSGSRAQQMSWHPLRIHGSRTIYFLSEYPIFGPSTCGPRVL